MMHYGRTLLKVGVLNCYKIGATAQLTLMSAAAIACITNTHVCSCWQQYSPGGVMPHRVLRNLPVQQYQPLLLEKCLGLQRLHYCCLVLFVLR